MSSYVPHDLTFTPEPHVTDSSLAKLPLRPKHRPEKWDSAKLAALADKDNWRKWDSLFRVLDESWAAAANKDTAHAAHAATKSAFRAFLLRFPYLAQHWRQFSVLMYKMGGTHESVDCLKDAVAAYPQSVLLWVEYLAALMTVGKSETAETAGTPTDTSADVDQPNSTKNGDDSGAQKAAGAAPASGPKTVKVPDLRAEFERAAALIGHNFNSDPFWNKYIEYETTLAESGPSPALLHVYLRLIRIPLYQYAQYYNQFTAVSKAFEVSDIIPDVQLPTYLAVFGKMLADDLSVVEKHQIIDTFAYDVFTATQAQVTKKWLFEAALTVQEYTHSDAEIALVQAQTGEWIKYLDAEIAACALAASGAKLEKRLRYDLTANLFERSLVPNCLHTALWHKYIAFVQSHCPDPEESVRTRNSLYKKAIFTFLPVSEARIRAEYAAFLLGEKSFEAANQFLFDTVRLYSGVSGPRIYAKAAYVHDLTHLFSMWAKLVPSPDVIGAFEALIAGYFSRVDRYKKGETKEAKAGKPESTSPEKAHSLKPEYSTAVSRHLNDDGICVVAVHLLRQMAAQPEDTEGIRRFYNRYHSEGAFSRSVQFWRFFVEFEGYTHKNLANLRAVVKHVKTATALPKMAVDAFLDIYYEVTCANLAQALSLLGPENYLDILVTIGAEKSDDLVLNAPARTRLAKNNYLIPEHKLAPRESKEDALMKMRGKHLAHPGVFVDVVPEFTTRLMDGKWISLLDDAAEPPFLPSFKNLDKANAPISYPDE